MPSLKPRRGRWWRGGRLAQAALAMACLGAGEPVREVPMPARSPADASTPREPALPMTIAGWTRNPAVRRIETSGIFEYMDGAGELYLAYRFDHLDAAEYAAGGQGEILVELYWMRGSDDAFGLLSTDWGGEPVSLAQAPASRTPRALYGSGLLRIWSDSLYARVLASHETEAARSAVLELGRRIVAGRPEPAPPRLASTLPPVVAPGFTLRSDTVCFLRSHLVLNSTYFVSHQNILNLDRTVDAVTARYDRAVTDTTRQRARLLLVRYQDAGAARAALARFRAAYLPETLPDPKAADTGFARIEDGWAGYRLSGPGLAVVFEAPDREAAASFVAAGAETLAGLEASHG